MFILILYKLKNKIYNKAKNLGGIMADHFGDGANILWKDRKRWCGLPWSFTRYYLVEKPGNSLKLFTSIGLLSTYVEEVNLYRITDISVVRTLTNKIWGTGTIVLHCDIDSSEEVRLIRINQPLKVRAMLAELIEQERVKKGHRISEFSY